MERIRLYRGVAILVLLLSTTVSINAQKIQVNESAQTGAINMIKIDGDIYNMNWILSTDGSQYDWIGENYGWGLGSLMINNNLEQWTKPTKRHCSSNSDSVYSITTYNMNGIQLEVMRNSDKNILNETYKFKNISGQELHLSEIAINTPFNDNYPDAKTSCSQRCNAHIWTGGSDAYVNCMRMGGSAPHLGLAVNEGCINGYEIKERDMKKGSSNYRGVIVLNSKDVTLQAGKEYVIAWTLFSHDGEDDFYKKLFSAGKVTASSSKYVYEKGEEITVNFSSKNKLENVVVEANNKPIKFEYNSDNTITAKYTPAETGDINFKLKYNEGKETGIQCLSLPKTDDLLRQRAYFIMNHQQVKDIENPLFGAYMVYDNETDSIYYNTARRSDCSEGRERLGMGIFMARYYQETKDESVKESLLQYATFTDKLQKENGSTFGNIKHSDKNRAYNYPWLSTFQFEMFNVTKDKLWLEKGYRTIMAMFNRFGHSFYAIDIPVFGADLLRENGYQLQADTLMYNYGKLADTYAANGLDYPKFEVNYEQSIVAPSVIHLLTMYLSTNDNKYLEAANKQMIPLEAFAGRQPSYHLNDIAIRHWDGYWFGKNRMWGDIFPHYWSTLSAVAYNLYYKSTGKKEYQQRALNIIKQNMSLISPDGKGSCAFVFPNKINGKSANIADPFSNDQDWALAFYYLIDKSIRH